MTKIIVYAAVAFVLCWLPLFVVGTLDPKANPIGLGLLGVVGTMVIAVATPVLLLAKLIARWRQ